MWIDALEATIDEERIGTHWDTCYLQHRDCAILRLIAVARAGRELYAIETEPDYSDLGEFTQTRRRAWVKRKKAALAAFRETDGGE